MSDWLRAAILAERAELLLQPPSHDRTEDLAACDRLLERLARAVKAKAAAAEASARPSTLS
jgi:hypothetical protein